MITFSPYVYAPLSLSLRLFLRGSDQMLISTKFEQRDDLSVVRNYGKLLLDIVSTVPDGVCCFFTRCMRFHFVLFICVTLCCFLSCPVLSCPVVLCCVVSNWIVLNCVVLCRVVLYCIVLYCIVLYCFVSCCVVSCLLSRYPLDFNIYMPISFYSLILSDVQFIPLFPIL